MTSHKLVSSVSKRNHSSGRFQLIMQDDGNLVQYPVLSFGLLPTHAYWTTQTDKQGDNITLNLDQNGRLYLLNDTGFTIRTISNAGQSLEQQLEWVSTTNKCDPTGLCGLNSYCNFDGQNAHCVCLPGFDFIDQYEKSLGCVKNSSTDGCEKKNGDTISLEELNGTSWDESSYSVVSLDNKTACGEECLRDCNCQIALFQNQQCSKQRIPLRFGKPTQGNSLLTTFVKVKNRSSETTTIVSKRKNEQVRMGILIGSIVVSSFGLIALAISGALIYRFRIWSYRKIENRGHDKLLEDVALRPYTYAELEKATNGFTDRVGKGAFGTVFKGLLVSNSGRKIVAIKRLEKVIADGEREFRNEMKVIGKTHHKNLVKLLGYWHEGTNRLLVYEYMENGSLADFLFRSETKPTWEERAGIALNIARGILYLHEECETQIIHCDIKPENILMDEQNCAKIADFGLAKLLMPDQSRTYTGFRGTRGYVAPEWHRNMPITVKADVYSFGIVLFEIICCRSVDMDVPEDKVVLANWVYDCFLDGELDKLVEDEDLEENELQKMIKLGLWCIQEEPFVRPSMKKVCLMLEGTIEIPPPPNPTSSVSIVQID
ncbi:G-type lectin S-receptor-like serine/threonine-protein kinase RLK1 [Morus notabilis]|uniref:non-specific serine/threonine protein kinase n=1 Tax=Morus notabilis TaxID=981085 RepID=W9S055_9ROSA|nr:G-type lectin S-receptor-like serine/threonine-protein kinase RLK1 [Morus notabilis]